MIVQIAVLIVAAVLGLLFPAYFINAVRAKDEEKAEDNKTKACLSMGALLFLLFWVLLGS